MITTRVTSTSKARKNLPKRCSNDKLKARRHESWLRGQERKKKRREENEARHRANERRGSRRWDEYNERRTAAWRAGGRTAVTRTACGNIIRPDGRVEACCNARRRDRFGDKLPCVHMEWARDGKKSAA